MNRILKKYLNNQCNDQEFNSALKLLLSEKKQEEINKNMQEHWQQISDHGNIPEHDKTLYSIHYHINKNEGINNKIKSLSVYLSRIAAILILPLLVAVTLLSIDYFSQDVQMQTVFSPIASRTSFELPDGSKVWLNSGSTLTFPNKFSKKRRAVELKGQAFFDVKKSNTPFEIESRNFKVNVLGTAFDISAYEDEVASVTLVRGKVSVETSNGNEAVLIPGEQAIIQEKSIKRIAVNAKLLTSWTEDLLVFDHEPFEKAVLKLERWYNIKISIQDEAIKKLEMNGTFQYETISEILQLMEITNRINHSYDKEKRTINLKLNN